ncbi:MAG: sugar transferase [Acidimicrobiales bacterium]
MFGRTYPAIKRAIDVAVAALLLIVLSPVLAAIALVVVATMGRPILFRQERPGLHGRPFTLAKFRTMRNGEASDADRLTSVGRMLRATSLDELPELWNVIRGDMSLVGPRPLLMSYLPLYSERQARRHEVRPGITGLAQVSGRNDLNWDTRFETDVAYVEDLSLTLDLRIMARTVTQVLHRDGISAEGEATMPHFTGSSAAPKPELATQEPARSSNDFGIQNTEYGGPATADAVEVTR